MKQNKKPFLSKFIVKNFKGLQKFELDDLGHVNLILGDNNVGKTSVLESLTFSDSPNQFLANLRTIYHAKINERELESNVDFITPFFNYNNENEPISLICSYKNTDLETQYSIQNREWSTLTKLQREKAIYFPNRPGSNPRVAVVKIGAKEYVIPHIAPSLYDDDILYIPFVFPKDLYGSDLLRFYSKSIVPSKLKKQQLIKDMRCFIPRLEDIEIALSNVSEESELMTRLEDADSVLPLSMYGDGSIKFFRILLEIAISANGRLMIDEIDSGIHFSRLKSLWRTVISSAVNNNTQLFITTHNDECLKFLKEVLEEKEFASMQSKSKCYTLKQLPNGSVKAYKYDFKDFAFAMNQNIELRGGKA